MPVNFHRTVEWIGLEGTLKIIYFQLPAMGQGHQPPVQAAQGPIQPDLEYLWGGGIHSFSGQSVSVPHCPLGNNFFPDI